MAELSAWPSRTTGVGQGDQAAGSAVGLLRRHDLDIAYLAIVHMPRRARISSIQHTVRLAFTPRTVASWKAAASVAHDFDQLANGVLADTNISA
jgi:hypothetical protein